MFKNKNWFKKNFNKKILKNNFCQFIRKIFFYTDDQLSFLFEK